MQPLNDVNQTIQTGWEKPIGIQPRHSIIGMSASQENLSKIHHIIWSISHVYMTDYMIQSVSHTIYYIQRIAWGM